MTFHPNDVRPWLPPAPENDDQLPLFARVGRGIRGDSFGLRQDTDGDHDATVIQGLSYDEATKEWTSEWFTENINGGRLYYAYNLRPWTTPKTFTITFIYRKPEVDGLDDDGEVMVTDSHLPYQGDNPEGWSRLETDDGHTCSWSWTTPAIPYVWDDEDANIGSGVADLYTSVKDAGGNWTDWSEELVYPDGTTGADYNAPNPLEPWTVNLKFGAGGDVEVVNFWDLAKILGFGTADDLVDWVLNDGKPHFGKWQDVKSYIDGHLHEDLGWDDENYSNPTDGDSGGQTVKDRIGDALGFGNHIVSFGDDLLTIKDYIDNMVDNVIVKSGNNWITVTPTTYSHDLDGDFTYGILYNLVFNSSLIKAGDGITITRGKDGSATINNIFASDDYITLTEGEDFVMKWHNGFYAAGNSPYESGTYQTNHYYWTKSYRNSQTGNFYSKLRLQLMGDLSTDESKDKGSFRLSVDIMPKSGYTTGLYHDGWLTRDGKITWEDDNEEVGTFKFRHSDGIFDVPESWVCSFYFKGDYAFLNEKSVRLRTSNGSNIWNVAGRDDGTRMTDDNASSYDADLWYNPGASWTVNCSLTKALDNSHGNSATDSDNGTYYRFVVAANNLADGYNSQYSTPKYDCKYLYLERSNFDWSWILK